MIRHPLDYLEIMWQKPEPVRKMITAVTTGFIMAVIIAIWVSTISLEPISSSTASAKPLQEQESPFAITWNVIKNIWKQ